MLIQHCGSGYLIRSIMTTCLVSFRQVPTCFRSFNRLGARPRVVSNVFVSRFVIRPRGAWPDAPPYLADPIWGPSWMIHPGRAVRSEPFFEPSDSRRAWWTLPARFSIFESPPPAAIGLDRMRGASGSRTYETSTRSRAISKPSWGWRWLWPWWRTRRRSWRLRDRHVNRRIVQGFHRGPSV